MAGADEAGDAEEAEASGCVVEAGGAEGEAASVGAGAADAAVGAGAAEEAGASGCAVEGRDVEGAERAGGVDPGGGGAGAAEEDDAGAAADADVDCAKAGPSTSATLASPKIHPRRFCTLMKWLQ